MKWLSEGRGRYSATTDDGRRLVIVREHGHFGGNTYAFQAWRVDDDDVQEFIVQRRRLRDVFKYFENLS